VYDQLFNGRKIRVLTVVDSFTRLSSAIDARYSYRGADVVATLEQAAHGLGYKRSGRKNPAGLTRRGQGT
jgi:putative transposase